MVRRMDYRREAMTKLTEFKPLQDEVVQLRAENKLLLAECREHQDRIVEIVADNWRLLALINDCPACHLLNKFALDK